MKTVDLEVVPLSIRIHRKHLQLIEEAAALVPGRTVSDYVREVLPAQAAADLDVDLPAMPPITRGHHGSLEAQAAAQLGVSLAEFRKNATRMAAAQVLGAEIVDGRDGRQLLPTPPSPRHPRKHTPSGTYSQQHASASPRSQRPAKNRG